MGTLAGNVNDTCLKTAFQTYQNNTWKWFLRFSDFQCNLSKKINQLLVSPWLETYTGLTWFGDKRIGWKCFT